MKCATNLQLLTKKIKSLRNTVRKKRITQVTESLKSRMRLTLHRLKHLAQVKSRKNASALQH